MISKYNNYSIIIGGKYGITCEEINEEKLGETLDRIIIKNPKLKIILTDELGKSLISKIKNNEKGNIEYISKLDSAINQETKNNKNILLIYRSNYSQINKS